MATLMMVVSTKNPMKTLFQPRFSLTSPSSLKFLQVSKVESVLNDAFVVLKVGFIVSNFESAIFNFESAIYNFESAIFNFEFAIFNIELASPTLNLPFSMLDLPSPLLDLLNYGFCISLMDPAFPTSTYLLIY